MRALGGQRVVHRHLWLGGQEAVGPEQVEQGPGPETEPRLAEHVTAGEQRRTNRTQMMEATLHNSHSSNSPSHLLTLPHLRLSSHSNFLNEPVQNFKQLSENIFICQGRQ